MQLPTGENDGWTTDGHTYQYLLNRSTFVQVSNKINTNKGQWGIYVSGLPVWHFPEQPANSLQEAKAKGLRLLAGYLRGLADLAEAAGKELEATMVADSQP